MRYGIRHHLMVHVETNDHFHRTITICSPLQVEDRRNCPLRTNTVKMINAFTDSQRDFIRYRALLQEKVSREDECPDYRRDLESL